MVRSTGLNSSDVPATLFDLEMKGFVRHFNWRGSEAVSMARELFIMVYINFGLQIAPSRTRL
jgi:hypothetical protein